MKFVTIRDFRSGSGQVLKQLQKESEMVITSNGKPVALLTSLSDESLEGTLKTIHKAKAIAAINAMQMKSAQKGTAKMSLEQINAEITTARKGKKRESRD